MSSNISGDTNRSVTTKREGSDNNLCAAIVRRSGSPGPDPTIVILPPLGRIVGGRFRDLIEEMLPDFDLSMLILLARPSSPSVYANKGLLFVLRCCDGGETMNAADLAALDQRLLALKDKEIATIRTLEYFISCYH